MKPDDVRVQLATRVPRSLLHRLRVWCVRHETTMQAFVTDAVREKLRRGGKPKT